MDHLVQTTEHRALLAERMAGLPAERVQSNLSEALDTMEKVILELDRRVGAISRRVLAPAPTSAVKVDPSLVITTYLDRVNSLSRRLSDVCNLVSEMDGQI